MHSRKLHFPTSAFVHDSIIDDGLAEFKYEIKLYIGGKMDKKIATINIQLFSDRLASLIKIKGKTISKISQDIGVSRTTIGNYLKKDSKPNPTIIKLLADYFGVSMYYLAGLSNVKDYSDPKIVEICEYTGLTEDAVKTLHDMKFLREVSSWDDEYKDYYDTDSKYHLTTFPYLSALITLRTSDADMDVIDSEIEQYCKASKALRTLEEKEAKLIRERDDFEKKFLEYDNETGGLIDRYNTQHEYIDNYRRRESGENIFWEGLLHEERTIEEIEEDQKAIREEIATKFPDLDLEALCEKYTELSEYDFASGLTSEILRQKTIKSRTLMDIIEQLNNLSTVL